LPDAQSERLSMPDYDNPSPHDLSDYEIHSRREIIRILVQVSESRQLVHLRVAGSADAAVTSILAVEDDYAIIDCAPSRVLNQHIVESDHLLFETVLDNIRILFETGGAVPCDYDGAPALQIAIPETLVRLQRREFYRVATPAVNPVLCNIQIEEGERRRVIAVPLQNISAGGIAIVDEQKLLNPTIGFVYSDCRIVLPGNVTLTFALEIRNLRDITLANGKTIRRLGCAFIDLPSPMLSAVQRYITSLEREQNAKNTGML